MIVNNILKNLSEDKLNLFFENKRESSFKQSIFFGGQKDLGCKKLFTTNFLGFEKYFKKITINFPCSFAMQNGNLLIFYFFQGVLYKMIVSEGSSIDLSVDFETRNVECESKGIYNLKTSKNGVILSCLTEKKIMFFDLDMKLQREILHDNSIISMVEEIGDFVYFIDISDSFNRIDNKNQGKFGKKFTPEFLGSNFNSNNDNYLIDDYIFYGSSSSTIYCLDLDLKLKKTYNLESKFGYIKNKPLKFKNSVILSSDSNILNVENLEIKDSISVVGSFISPFIFQNSIVVSFEKFLFFFDIENGLFTLKKYIYFGRNSYILDAFIFNNQIFVIDDLGNLFHIFEEKFYICGSGLITDHKPVISLWKDMCFISVLNRFGELNIYLLK